MKKFYIPILGLIIAFGTFGCEKKAENSMADSGTATAPNGAAAVKAGETARPATSITPPAPAAPTGPLTVALPATPNGNTVLIYVWFTVPKTGAQPQVLTINNGGTMTTYNSPASSGPPSANYIPLPIFPTSNPETVTITDQINGAAPSSAISFPVNSNTMQQYGWDLTRFMDGNGNEAMISVIDLAGN